LIVDKAGGVRGDARGEIILKKNSIAPFVPIKDYSYLIRAEFTDNKLVTQFTFLKIPITVMIMPGKFEIYAWDERIFPLNEGKQVASLPEIGGAINKKHKLPWELREAHFVTRWSKNNTDPELITPSGLRITKHSTYPGISYQKLVEAKLAFYIIKQPEGGLWTFVVPNENSIGKARCSVAIYENGPSFHFRKVTPLGGNTIRIEWSQSGGKETKIDLLYGSCSGTEAKRLIASSRSIGSGRLEWLWDTSQVQPGQYYIYARITDTTSPPIVLRYDKPMKIGPSIGINPPQNIQVRLRNSQVHVIWTHANSSQVEYYKLYYGVSSEDASPKQFISCRSTQNHIILDTEHLKPGRCYDIALSAVYGTKQESALSPIKKVVYKCRGVNNLPTFITKPKTTAVVDKKYVYKAKATDLDNNKVSYALQQSPFGMRINSKTGEIVWLPEEQQIGRHWIELLAIDSKGGVEFQNYTLTVMSPSSEGQFEFRPLACGAQQGLMLIYRNPHLNLEREQFDQLAGKLGSGYGPYETPINLMETEQDSGIFTAFIPLEKIQSIAYVPYGLISASTADLNNIKMDEIRVRLEGENRMEFDSFRILRQN
jgi:hypothetical protein